MRSMSTSFNPINPGGRGGGKFDPPLYFFAITQKVFKLGSSHFLATNLTSTGSSLNAEFSGIQHKCLILPIPDYIIFTNLYLDLPPVIGLQNFEVL